MVERELSDSRAEVFYDAAVAGAVVGDGKVVVDGLRDADNAHFVALRRRVVGDFIGSVLRVVSADVEEEADIVRLEDFDDARVVLFALEFVAACSERRRGSVAQPADCLLRFLRQVDEFFVQNAFHSVECAVNFFDAIVVKSFGDDTREARIYDGGGAARLRHQDVSCQLFFHIFYVYKFLPFDIVEF